MGERAVFHLLFFMIVKVANCDYFECREGPCVTTPMGRVFGRQVESILGNGDLKRVDTYRGIPYAQPPIGDLRFADPQPKTSWTGLLRATSYGKTCFGTIFKAGRSLGLRYAEMWNPPGNEAALAEDCLYLNIWTPTRNTQQSKPVMVWIYGGSFITGSSSLWEYNGQFLSAAQDMVVVSFNYRVGALGFLKTRDGKIPGNLGLKDQQMALKWVHENIHHFGGNNATITLVGMSAGAASVGYHQLSQGSWGYYKSAVMNSGSPFAEWAYTSQDDIYDQSDQLLKQLRCSEKDNLLQCLRSLSPLAIFEQDRDLKWAPTVDGTFLTDTPKNLISKGKYNKVPLLISLNKNEGSVFAYIKLGDRFTTRNGRLKPITLERFRSNMDTIFPETPEAERDTAIDMYTQGIKSNGTALSLAVSEVIGDSSFVCPVLRWADDMTRGNHVYFLRLDYRSSIEESPEWMGVLHGADYQWTFGIPLDRDRNYQQREIDLAEKYMKYLGNFIRTGDPNGGRLPNWYPFSGRQALCIQNNMSIASCDVMQRSRDRCWRWNAILGLSGSGTKAADFQLTSLLSVFTILVISCRQLSRYF
ncbi:acetylcholinesterase-like [Lineus longissimus]|uniref:acetylcholinesterase-like n=1 Tax=Lineus longissimus TaxID=88925 RepID=UPI002B4D0BC5